MRKLKFWISAGVAALLAGTSMPASAGSWLDHSPWAQSRLRHFCFEMTDYQVRKLIAGKGYSQIYLNAPDSHRIQVRAARDGWVYLLSVNTCNGTIIDRERLRRQ